MHEWIFEAPTLARAKRDRSEAISVLNSEKTALV